MPPSKVNVFISIFTMPDPHLEMYSNLEKLGRRVLYIETNSIIMKGESPLEIEPLGNNIQEFARLNLPFSGLPVGPIGCRKTVLERVHRIYILYPKILLDYISFNSIQFYLYSAFLQ